MKVSFLPAIGVLSLAPSILTLVGGCASTPPQTGPTTFRQVLPLLETKCVHCHGEQRLPSMPALTDTRALAALIGPARIIVPGEPERSRFFQVVTFADNQAGAMPPTGHAISKREVKTLRAWIQAGAPLPAENIALTPRGTAIRSL